MSHFQKPPGPSLCSGIRPDSRAVSRYIPTCNPSLCLRQEHVFFFWLREATSLPSPTLAHASDSAPTSLPLGDHPWLPHPDRDRDHGDHVGSHRSLDSPSHITRSNCTVTCGVISLTLSPPVGHTPPDLGLEHLAWFWQTFNTSLLNGESACYPNMRIFLLYICVYFSSLYAYLLQICYRVRPH